MASVVRMADICNLHCLPRRRCEGHFLFLPVPNQHMVIAVCEGLHHMFGAWTKACPKTGATAEHFYGEGCLGTGSSIMKKLTTDAPAATAAAASHAASSSVLEALLGHLWDDLLLQPEDELALSSFRSSSAAVAVGAGEVGGSRESRCTGHSGEMRGVKWGGETSAEVLGALGQAAQPLFESLKGV